MAKNEAEENPQDAAADGKGKKGSKKFIIIIVLVLLLAIGASGGVTWYLLGSDSAEKAVAEDVAPEVPVKGPAEYFEFRKPLVVTFNVGNKQRFLQAHITLLLRQVGVYDALELHLPVLQNRLLNVFGSQDFTAIQTHEGRIDLQEKAKQAINQVLSEQNVEGEIEQVLFTNLVMQ